MSKKNKLNNEKMQAVVNQILKRGFDYTTTGNYIADYQDVEDLITQEEFRANMNEIGNALMVEDNVLYCDVYPLSGEIDLYFPIEDDE